MFPRPFLDKKDFECFKCNCRGSYVVLSVLCVCSRHRYFCFLYSHLQSHIFSFFFKLNIYASRFFIQLNFTLLYANHCLYGSRSNAIKTWLWIFSCNGKCTAVHKHILFLRKIHVFFFPCKVSFFVDDLKPAHTVLGKISETYFENAFVKIIDIVWHLKWM